MKPADHGHTETDIGANQIPNAKSIYRDSPYTLQLVIPQQTMKKDGNN